MGHGDREELVTQDRLRLEGSEAHEPELGDGAARRCLHGFIEDVGKAAKQLVVRALRAKDRHVPPGTEAEDPEIVGAMNVIGMKVGNPDRMDVIHTLPHQLEAKFRRGIHEQVALPESEERSMSGAAVSRILRDASGTSAPDHRNPEGGTCPEECELHHRLLRVSPVYARRYFSRGLASRAISPHRRDLLAGAEEARP